MPQNTSSAVMQQRHEAHDSLDDFPTAPWATRALFEHVLKPSTDLDFRSMDCWEPCCNRGYMARPLLEYFPYVFCSDVHDYGWSGQDQVVDFLFPDLNRFPSDYDAFVFNPPFRLAVDFIFRAMELQPKIVAVFVRSAFLEGADRYRRLYSDIPPTLTAFFCERVILSKGIVRDPSKPYWDEAARKMRRPSTATAYAWLVWVDGMAPQPPVWIPPCRTKLERHGDYDAP